MKHIKNYKLYTESLFIPNLEPIQNIEVYTFLKNRRFSEEDNRKLTCQFQSKDRGLFYIVKTINSDMFKVYDGEKLIENILSKLSISNDITVGVAVFDTSNLYKENGYFTGYKENISIQVNDEYKRKGIATAIIDFAEKVYKAPYKPSALLSDEMQKFIDNRNNNPIK
jgi:hypothetical protein